MSEDRGFGEDSIGAAANINAASREDVKRLKNEGRFALIVVIALLMADFGLIFIIYRQLNGHKSDYAISELVIYLGLIFAVTIIAIAVIRIAVQQYKSPLVTIPPDDRKLLEDLIRNENSKAIELYVRLSSLGGPTGTATKLGLTGLPLATIGLTVFFTLISLFVPTFLDLAKLTLGAFIGSFVQRSGEAIERAVRAGSANVVVNSSGQTPAAASGVAGATTLSP